MNNIDFFKRNLFYINKILFKKTKVSGFYTRGSFNIFDLKHINKIIIYLDNPSIIHLGDQLFFYCLAEILNKKQIEILIKKENDIIFNPKYKLSKKFKKNYLIISSLKLLCVDFFKLKDLNLLGIDFNEFKANKNLADSIIDAFENLMIPCKKKFFFDPNIYNNNKQRFNSNKKYIIFNDEIFSSFPLNIEIKNNLLIKYAIYLKQRLNVDIVKLGSIKRNYEKNFIDIDLSGLISKNEIFELVGNDYCVGVISYDNFFMHSASLFNKNIYVMPRGRIKHKNSIKILNLTVPFFNSKSTITIIDNNYKKFHKLLINKYSYFEA